MKGVMQYLLDTNNLDGTNCMRHVESLSKPSTYKLKSTSG